MKPSHLIGRTFLALGIAVVGGACSNSGSSGTITPSGVTPGSKALPAQIKPGSSAVEFAYVTNSMSGDIWTYKIDAASGELTKLSFVTLRFPAIPRAVAIDSLGKFAYVTDVAPPGNVSGYAIDPDSGALTALKTSPFKAGLHPQDVAIDPEGKFAYVSNLAYPKGDRSISAYTIERDGALTDVKGSPISS
jgi:6-phosphogluconolactonase